MASTTREHVSFPGILRGQATCTVRATKFGLLGSNDFNYSPASIANVSKPLPDGEYQLLLAGVLHGAVREGPLAFREMSARYDHAPKLRAVGLGSARHFAEYPCLPRVF